jgi:TRAP-type C4-dicarboxylate transport system permease small subunit
MSNQTRGNEAPGSLRRTVGSRVHRLLFDWIPALLLVVIVGVVLADVVGRYLLSSPIVWASEVALVSFIWLVYLAAVSVAAHGGHIAVDVVTGRLPQRWQAVLATLSQLLTLAVLSYLTYYGFRYFAEGRFTSLPGLGLSKAFVELAIPVSALALGLHAVRDLVDAVRGVGTGRYRPRSDRMATEEVQP